MFRNKIHTNVKILARKKGPKLNKSLGLAEENIVGWESGNQELFVHA